MFKRIQLMLVIIFILISRVKISKGFLSHVRCVDFNLKTQEATEGFSAVNWHNQICPLEDLLWILIELERDKSGRKHRSREVTVIKVRENGGPDQERIAVQTETSAWINKLMSGFRMWDVPSILLIFPSLLPSIHPLDSWNFFRSQYLWLCNWLPDYT